MPRQRADFPQLSSILDLNFYALMSEMEQDLAEIQMSLARIEKAMKIVPDKEITIKDSDSSLKSYEQYATDTLKLVQITINNHLSAIRSFLVHSKGRINKDAVKAYLDSNDSSSWKTNQLKALRKYCRDFLKLGKWIEEFGLEKVKVKVRKDLPSDQELISFFNELPAQEQMIFVLLHNSGLRLGEVLSLKVANLDFETNMIDASDLHKGKTKSSWISFFTDEASQWLNDYLENNGLVALEVPVFSISSRAVQQAFKNASIKLGLDINPHLLRTIFVEKCRQAGIDKDYIDAFQGRMPKSVLAKHYTDYSPQALRQQYDKLEGYLILG